MSEAAWACISAVIVALIGAVVNIIDNRRNWKKVSDEETERQANRDKKEAVWRARLEDHLATVDHKLDVHNGYAEKLGGIEKSIAVIETEIKNLKGV